MGSLGRPRPPVFSLPTSAVPKDQVTRLRGGVLCKRGVRRFESARLHEAARGSNGGAIMKVRAATPKIVRMDLSPKDRTWGPSSFGAARRHEQQPSLDDVAGSP
jgi:hypothetical protein